jgi:ketosteroid isomerase-like protein
MLSNMKYIKIKSLLILILLFIYSCTTATEKKQDVKTAIENELAKIESLRANFQLAIKEKRYSDLSKYATKDIIAIGPASAEWQAYRKMREEPKGLFSYDSIIMYPKETVIVSDTVAYDFGVSSVFYTDSAGNTIELKDSFLVILKKDTKGNWRLHREVASGLIK